MPRSTSASAATRHRSSTKKKPLRDPQGGLTAAGRAHYAETEQANLCPGVSGPVDTAEKMRRKGSFLRRNFANPQGPLANEKGDPTRLAKSAHAWGEKVPQNATDAQKLAHEGKRLLTRYQKTKKSEDSSQVKALSKTKALEKSKGKHSTKASSTSKSPVAVKAAAKTKIPQGKTARSAAQYTKPALRERLKKKIKSGDKGGTPGQWSARKAQLVASEYRKAGGDYKAGTPSASQKNLQQWTGEQEKPSVTNPPAARRARAQA